MLSVAGVQGISKKVAAIEITINGPGFAHLLHLMMTMIQIDDDFSMLVILSYCKGTEIMFFTSFPSTPKIEFSTIWPKNQYLLKMLVKGHLYIQSLLRGTLPCLKQCDLFNFKKSRRAALEMFPQFHR